MSAQNCLRKVSASLRTSPPCSPAREGPLIGPPLYGGQRLHQKSIAATTPGRESPKSMTAPSAYLRKPDAVLDAIAHIRRGLGLSPHVLLGPIVWWPDGDRRLWYFAVGSGDAEGFHVDQISSRQKSLAVEFRAGIYAALMQERAIVVHDFGDELDMARWAEAIWPGPTTQNIRSNIEAERTSASAAMKRT